MLHTHNNKIYPKYLKRIFDFIFALILLIFVFLLILICALIIKIEDPTTPVIFTQARPGKNCKIFKIFKLRTMRADTKKNEVNLTDQQRLLKSGELIRKLSLDELPQIINILKGEMSFIGPRPLLVEYLDYYTPQENRRHDVLPGITGWAQVNGRNGPSWKKRFECDVFYVNNVSLNFDIHIFFKTIYKVFLCKDIKIGSQDYKANFYEYRSAERKSNKKVSI
jgi:undecaprenyl phosphate N,N'-diacetylbacillosamine 1-phosphate transferase